MRPRAILAGVLVSLMGAAPAVAAPTLVSVGTFAQPVHVAAPPGDVERLFVVEKAGRVQVVVNGQTAATPFLDIAAGVSSGGERGLLSIAYPSDYAATGLFYIFYTDSNGDLVIREGQRTPADPNRGEPGRILFTIEHSAQDNHNGGQLAFGPDGALYVSTGDGGTQNDPEGDAACTWHHSTAPCRAFRMVRSARAGRLLRCRFTATRLPARSRPWPRAHSGSSAAPSVSDSGSRRTRPAP
jgi:glucose/arabinose dehydrogenase